MVLTKKPVEKGEKWRFLRPQKFLRPPHFQNGFRLSKIGDFTKKKLINNIINILYYYYFIFFSFFMVLRYQAHDIRPFTLRLSSGFQNLTLLRRFPAWRTLDCK
nr:MAG TPA: hypothetical protein [Caudoviricetes sp.]